MTPEEFWLELRTSITSDISLRRSYAANVRGFWISSGFYGRADGVCGSRMWKMNARRCGTAVGRRHPEGA